uniref:Uncharacterized protein n=1 Tax=Opuntia streptacantha TaxID=393608 RepID=A0A7C9AVQ0_OPUST
MLVSLISNCLSISTLDFHCIKEGLLLNFQAKLLQPSCKYTGQPMYPLGYGFKTFWSMINSVHSGHVGKQSLSSADVASGLVPSNMLLPCLHRHAKSRLPRRINTNTYDPSRHQSLVFL